MKNSGGKDTALLFFVLLLALGAVCYLCVIKKNLDNLNSVKTELAEVEQEKARNDAIIEQADQLDAQKKTLVNELKEIEGKLLPDLNTAAIQRKIYKYFEDAKIPFVVKVENTALTYDTVTLPDGTVSVDRVKWSNYKIRVSGTDGFMLTHDEGDKIPDEVFYTQLTIPVGDKTKKNEEANKIGYDDAYHINTDTYVGYDEFVTALENLQREAPAYVKVSDIEIEDMGQGFCEFTAAVNVYAYDLVNRKSIPDTNMQYMNWVGIENILTGGIVGMPSYFALLSPSYSVPESSELYGVYISFVDYDFNVNRPFAAWNHWAFEWNLFDEIKGELSTWPAEVRRAEVQYRIGMISQEEYNKQMGELNKKYGSQGDISDEATTTTTRP